MPRQRGIVVPISAEENTGRAFEQVNARVAALQAQVRSLSSQLSGAGNPGERLAEGMRHAVPETAAASAAVRSFEGNPGIRAVERFLSTTLGLGPALKAAFPVIGALAFLDIIVNAGKKLKELYDIGTGKNPELLRAFNEFDNGLRKVNDDLEVQKAKLEQEYDKLQKKPNNGIALSLAEAKQRADEFYQSLDNIVQKLDEVLKKQEVGTISQLLTGQASTTGLTDEIKRGNEALEEKAAGIEDAFSKNLLAAGQDKGKIADAERERNRALDQALSERIDVLDKRSKEFQQKQKDIKAQQERESAVAGYNPYGPSAAGIGQAQDFTASIRDNDEARRTFERARTELRLRSDINTIQGNVNAAKGEKVGGKDSGKVVADANKALADAVTKQREQSDQDDLNAAKRSAEGQIAALDDLHKRQLVSDQDYYAAKAAIQEQALTAEYNALGKKQVDLGARIAEAQADATRPRRKDESDPEFKANAIRDQAKVVELQTQIDSLEQQRLKLVQDRAKIEKEADTEAYQALQKQIDLSLRLAAEREGITGGSTDARNALAQRQFEERTRDETPVERLQEQQALNLQKARNNVSGAEQSYQGSESGISNQRQILQYSQLTGQISDQQAQQGRIALDRQEADALQGVLTAKEAAAALGDAAAADQVAGLQERIRELRAPVDEVAAHIREQFDGAFEGLFDNLDKGKKDFADFAKQILKDIQQDAFKQLLEPSIQQGLGKVIPNGGSNKGNPTPGLGSLLSGIPGLNRIPGIGIKGGGAGAVTVEIINQGAPLSSGGSTQQQGAGSDDGDFTNRVISVVLKDFDGNGSLAQAIPGLLGG